TVAVVGMAPRPKTPSSGSVPQPANKNAIQQPSEMGTMPRVIVAHVVRTLLGARKLSVLFRHIDRYPRTEPSRRFQFLPYRLPSAGGASPNSAPGAAPGIGRAVAAPAAGAAPAPAAPEFC